jgi:predicted DNA-binding transcriptional regulator AlpA
MSSSLTERALLSARDAAAFLGVSLTSFRDHVGNELPTVRIGRRVLYDRRDLQHWIEARKTTTDASSVGLANISGRARAILASLRAR